MKKFNQEENGKTGGRGFNSLLGLIYLELNPLGNLKGFQPDLQNLRIHFGN